MAVHRHHVRIYYEDTDFSGRVYHGAYVRFLERGRSEFLRAAGLDHHALGTTTRPLFFTLSALDVRFHAPAGIDDMVTVETAAEGPIRAAARMDQAIRRDGTLLVTALATLCLIDGAGKPVRPPEAVRRVLSGAAGTAAPAGQGGPDQLDDRTARRSQRPDVGEGR